MPTNRQSRRPGEEAGSAAAPVAGQAGVLLPLPLRGPYDYSIPGGMELVVGDFVVVPLGGRELTGVVWGPARGEVAAARLRPVSARIDAPPLPGPIRRLVDWVANWSLSPPGAVLRMVLAVPGALEPPRALTGWVPDPQASREGLRMTPARQRVLAVAGEGAPRTAADLAREAACTPGVVRGLADRGLLRPVPVPQDTLPARPDPARPGPLLSPAQDAAAATLRQAVEDGGFSVTLLDGVTGSGKTEVYFEATAAALAAGRQVLVLLPEIALGPQWLDRFEARFGERPAEWHSDLTQSRRRATWRAVQRGEIQVLVGARSALFLPFPDPGLIVVDEEHDAAYKQEEGVIYQARDMAVVRASLGGFPVILASATPSLETVRNVREGRYRRVHLPERHGAAKLPEVALVDMRQDGPPRGRWISPVLAGALAETLASGGQGMLFLNRRGYAPLTLCRACGHRIECPDCSAWLVEHRLARRLQCHHCGHDEAMPAACPACDEADALVACGPGVERIAEEAAVLFPEARVAMISSDTLSGPGAAAEFVRRVQAREVDLLVGTQLLAKGHHFPDLALVGVVDADIGLAGGDLRAGERTWQLLSQVAGRAGRARRPGRVLVQTFMPEHPVMQALASGDRESFMEIEAEGRRARGLPPFGRLAALVVSGADPDRTAAMARALGRTAPRGPGAEVLGPAPAPLAVLRGRHRWRLLLRAGLDQPVQKLLRAWLSRTPRIAGVRVKVDVDPWSFF